MKPTIRRGEIQVFHSFKEADEADRQFWWKASIEQRLAHMKHLREINYGARVTERLQRILSPARAEQR